MNTSKQKMTQALADQESRLAELDSLTINIGSNHIIDAKRKKIELNISNLKKNLGLS